MFQISHAPDPARTALVLIECQNEWLAADGKLQALIEDRTRFDAATQGAQRLLELARKHRLAVAHVGLGFQAGYPELGEGGFGLRGAIPHFGTFPKHSKASAFAKGFEPLPGEFVAEGRIGSSAFAGSNLDIWLRNNRIESVILGGFALHICVESSLRAAHDLGYFSYLASDATAAFTAEQRKHVLQHVVPHFGKAVTNEEIDTLFDNAKERAA